MYTTFCALANTTVARSAQSDYPEAHVSELAPDLGRASPRSFPDHHCPDYESITNHIQEERPRSTAPSLCTTPIIPDRDSGHAVAAGNERPRLAHVSIEVGMPVEVGG